MQLKPVFITVALLGFPFFLSRLVSLIDRRGFVPSDDSVQTSPMEIEIPAAKNDINMVGRAVTSGRPRPPPPPPVVTLQQPAISIQNHSTAWLLVSVPNRASPLLVVLFDAFWHGPHPLFRCQTAFGSLDCRQVRLSQICLVLSRAATAVLPWSKSDRWDLCLLWVWKGNKCL